jgi:hypothetical protein
MIKHQVLQGECVSSIAHRYGISWDKIWNDPQNSDLKNKRKHPGILCAGDVVVVPDRAPKTASCASGGSHELTVRQPRPLIRLQVFDGEKPRANQEYTLVVDGETLEGKTNGDGVLEEEISPDARKAKLTIGPDESVQELDLGHTDPISEPSGIAGRLENLGYFSGDPADEDKLRRALLLFQRRFGLSETGSGDAQTLQKLEDMHDKVGGFPADAPGSP